VYRGYAERIIRQVVGRYAAHPAVVGWQVDNETGIELLHNPGVVEGFQAWLEDRHGTIEALNERWGLAYWSHRLRSFDEVWPPDGNTNPGYDLDWRRFQAQIYTDFLAWQAAIVRELATPDQVITQCLVGAHGLPGADMRAIAQQIDLVGVNPYYPTQDALALPQPDDVLAGQPDWLTEGGVASVVLKADLAYGAAGSPFLVMETNATSIGPAHTNFPHWPGQRRLIVHTLLSRGAIGVGYWHWHTLHYGSETYWGGILGHDLRPGRTYRELADVGRELADLEPVLDGFEPEADIALLYDADARYALSHQAPLAVPGSGEPDRRAYERIVNGLHRACFDARLQVRVVHPATLECDGIDPAVHPVLVVPALYAVPDAMLDRLERYAAAGGHLVLTFRSGYADEHARVRWDLQPARLVRAVGASYQEYTNLARPVPVRAVHHPHLPPLEIPSAAAAASDWADVLQVPPIEQDGDHAAADVLATYVHPHLSGVPTITTRAHGAGRVTWLGTLPEPGLGAALLDWVRRVSLPEPLWTDLPVQVRVCGGRRADGSRVWFLGNFGDTPCTVLLPIPVEELNGVPHSAGERLPLAPWGSRIIVEPAAAAATRGGQA
jgi:beta-galactosidase